MLRVLLDAKVCLPAMATTTRTISIGLPEVSKSKAPATSVAAINEDGLVLTSCLLAITLYSMANAAVDISMQEGR